MLKHYLKITLRNLKKHKAFSFINIAGLAFGMACCLLIFLYVNDEISFDRQHEKSERIFRILSFSKIGGITREFAIAPAALAPAVKESLPEVERYTRLFDFGDANFAYMEKSYEVRDFYLADGDYFDIFSHEFLAGDPTTALLEPESLVITEETARKVFGDQEALGRSLTFGEGEGRRDFKITGIIKNVPKTSHFRFSMLLSAATFRRQASDQGDNSNQRPSFLEETYYFNAYSYLLLEPNANIPEIEDKIMGVVENRWGEMLQQRGVVRQYPLQNLKDIHLRSNYESDLGNPGNITYVYLFTAIALFVLFIACFNFVNLSTARATLRAREVGLRKVFGAFRRQLIRQFLSESILMSILGLILGFTLVSLLLPTFNSLTGKEFNAQQLYSPAVLLGLMGLILFSGFFAGSFPAFILSSFKPVKTIRGKLGSGTKGATLRKTLVVVQFTISIFMILSILVIVLQIDFLKKKELGFNKDHMVVLPLGGRNSEEVRSRILQNPNVQAVATSLNIPGQFSGDDTYLPEGKDQNETIRVSAFSVGYDFIDTYGMQIIQGRNFSRDFSTDAAEAVLINETTAREIGWGHDALGKQIVNVSRDNTRQTVIGIVSDFHHKSLKVKINPTVISLNPNNFRYVSTRIQSRNISATLGFLEGIWTDINPRREFTYFFIDDDFRSKYPSEERVRSLYFYFGLLAVFIACLGLYGLASFIIARRTKEIGIRKVLGAKVRRIVFSLSGEFIAWVLIANILAWPLAFYILNRWLQTFAYHIDLEVWMFVLSGLLALTIAFSTVSYQAFKSARANPVDALKYE